MNKIRLQIVLRDALSCSRRKAETYIVENRVKVNGKPACLGLKVNPTKDDITIDSKHIKYSPVKYVYLKLYKPRGYITSLKDECGRQCVADLISDFDVRLYPVGRLDYNSEGLLLITNDGDFANNVLNPRRKVPKTYLTTVSPQVKEEDITDLSKGIAIDGIKLKPAEIQTLKRYENRALLKVKICEGKNRQIRKMFGKFGYDVLRLKRTNIGNINLCGLRPGKYAHLTKAEISYFKS